MAARHARWETPNSRRTVLVGILLPLQLLFTYLPGFNRVFGTAPISIREWLAIARGAHFFARRRSKTAGTVCNSGACSPHRTRSPP